MFPEMRHIALAKRQEAYERAMQASPWWVRYHVAIAIVISVWGGMFLSRFARLDQWFPESLDFLSQAAIQVTLTLLLFSLAHIAIWPRIQRSVWKRIPHLCRTCGYDLTGNTSGTCPECGHVVEATDRDAVD